LFVIIIFKTKILGRERECVCVGVRIRILFKENNNKLNVFNF